MVPMQNIQTRKIILDVPKPCAAPIIQVDVFVVALSRSGTPENPKTDSAKTTNIKPAQARVLSCKILLVHFGIAFCFAMCMMLDARSMLGRPCRLSLQLCVPRFHGRL